MIRGGHRLSSMNALRRLSLVNMAICNNVIIAPMTGQH